MIRLRLRHLFAAIAVTATLTACGTAPSADTSSGTPAATTDAVEDDTAAPSTDMTEAIVDITWNQTSETDKQSICDGITLFGTDWAAEQIQQGAGDDSLDWNRAAVIIEGKCKTR